MTPALDPALNQSNKQAVWRWWQQLDQPNPDGRATATRELLASSVAFHGHDPVNRLDGVDAFLEGFWQPLRRSFPDLQRQTHIFMGGASNGRRDGNAALDGRHWVSGTGLMNGTFSQDYLGIPAHGRRVSLRWGEFCRVEDGKVAEIYFQLDLIDLLEQIGLQVLPESRGVEGLWPAPRAAVTSRPRAPRSCRWSKCPSPRAPPRSASGLLWSRRAAHFWTPPLWQSTHESSGSRSPPGCLKSSPRASSSSSCGPLP